MSHKGQGSSSKLWWSCTWRNVVRCASMHQGSDVRHHYCNKNTDHSWEGHEYHFLKFHQIILEVWYLQPFHLDLQNSKGCSSNSCYLWSIQWARHFELSTPSRKGDNLCSANSSNSSTLQESLYLCQQSLKEDISKNLLLGNHNFHSQECFERSIVCNPVHHLYYIIYHHSHGTINFKEGTLQDCQFDKNE